MTISVRNNLKHDIRVIVYDTSKKNLNIVIDERDTWDKNPQYNKDIVVFNTWKDLEKEHEATE